MIFTSYINVPSKFYVWICFKPMTFVDCGNRICLNVMVDTLWSKVIIETNYWSRPQYYSTPNKFLVYKVILYKSLIVTVRSLDSDITGTKLSNSNIVYKSPPYWSLIYKSHWILEVNDYRLFLVLFSKMINNPLVMKSILI